MIHISRAARQSTFPAQFQLVAAMNPCPCGWLGHPSGRCHCTPDRVARYRWRVSGPLLDRIDLAIGVPAVPPESLALNEPSSRGQGHDTTVAEPGREHAGHETSATIRSRVERARERQLARQKTVNARLQPADVARHCVPEAAAEELLAKAMTRLALSARAYHRVLKVARTIADLAGCDRIATVARRRSHRISQDGRGVTAGVGRTGHDACCAAVTSHIARTASHRLPIMNAISDAFVDQKNPDAEAPRLREIPYNYTSFSDREIVIRLLGRPMWQRP